MSVLGFKYEWGFFLVWTDSDVEFLIKVLQVYEKGDRKIFVRLLTWCLNMNMEYPRVGIEEYDMLHFY